MFPSINNDRCKRLHLRAPRRATSFTQVELAARLKIDQSNLSKVERGEHYVDVLFHPDRCQACM